MYLVRIIAATLALALLSAASPAAPSPADSAQEAAAQIGTEPQHVAGAEEDKQARAGSATTAPAEGQGHSEAAAAETSRVESPAARHPTDVVIVLDNSGSMKQNDPSSLTRQVVSEFAGQLSGAARLEIILFDSDVKVPLELTSVGAPHFAQQVDRSVSEVTYHGQRTNLPAALERAVYDLRSNGRLEAEYVIVLLTDGIVDVGSRARNVEGARWLRESLAPEAKRLGVRVFGIAFTEAADFQLIQSLAQATGGEYFRAFASSEVPAVFGEITRRLESIRGAAPAAGAGPALATASVAPPRATDARGPWVVAMGLCLLLFVLSAVVLVLLRRPREPTPLVVTEAGSQRTVPDAELRGVGAGAAAMRFPIAKAVTRIGRIRGTNDVVIPRDTVSAQHAALEFRNGVFYLRDLRSKNGSFLNGQKFSDPECLEIREVAIKNRDRIGLGGYQFEFVLGALEDADETRLVSAGAGYGAEPSPAASRGGARPVIVPADPANAPTVQVSRPVSVIQPAATADLPTGRRRSG